MGSTPLSPAIRLDPSLLHVFGYGVSAALDALLNDLAMHPRTSVECPQKLIHRYEGSDWVTNFAVGSFCGGSAANGTESAHCEANSAGVKPPRPLCGRRWL